LVAAAIVVVAVAPGADAAPETGSARAGAHHGIWNGVFATTRGNCSSGYSVPFTVTGGCVSSAGGKGLGHHRSWRRRRGQRQGRRVAGARRRPDGRQQRCRRLERDHFRRPLHAQRRA
jgi:hypothetical protein